MTLSPWSEIDLNTYMIETAFGGANNHCMKNALPVTCKVQVHHVTINIDSKGVAVIIQNIKI
jgi:hypothetical protein